MLGLFKVAVDNFMNIRLEAFQKRGGPRYDAQHAGQRCLMWMSLRDYQTYSTHIMISSCLKRMGVASF